MADPCGSRRTKMPYGWTMNNPEDPLTTANQDHLLDRSLSFEHLDCELVVTQSVIHWGGCGATCGEWPCQSRIPGLPQDECCLKRAEVTGLRKP